MAEACREHVKVDDGDTLVEADATAAAFDVVCVRWGATDYRHSGRGDLRLFNNQRKGEIMNRKLAVGVLAISALLGSAVVLAADDSDADRSHPKAFVKDSAITMKIKTKLAAEHITSLGRTHVDTDKDGVVWLS